MTRERYWSLVGLALFAVAAAGVDTLGWWSWQSAQKVLLVHAEEGARRLAGDRLLILPSAVERSRRLPTGELISVPIDLASKVLTKISAHQRSWMVAYPVGYTNWARAFLLASDLESAVPMLDQAVARDPTSPHLHRLRALILMARGELSAAMEDLAVAEAIAPGLRRPEVDLTPENEQEIRVRGLELRRDFYPRRRSETALMLARELRRTGDFEGAQMALVEFERHPEVLLERAKWAIDEGDAATASACLEEIIGKRSFPRRLRARAWSSLAVVRDQEGDHEAARAAAQQALSIDPRSPHVFVSLAGLAERRGEYDLALDYLRRAWGMSPADVSLLVRIARVAEKAGKNPDAVLAMERAVEVDPATPAIAARLVSLQLRLGRYTEAAVSLSRALDRHPTNPELLNLAERLRRDVGIR